MASDDKRLRASPAEIDQCLDQLDAAEHAPPAAERRQSERTPYRTSALEIELAPIGQAPTRHLVPTRNISRDGAAILLGRFVYPRTIVTVYLTSPDDDDATRQVRGTVVRCRYLSGTNSLYEVGVRFDQAIELAGVLNTAPELSLLVVAVDEATPKVLSDLLSPLPTRTQLATSPDQLSELVTRQTFVAALVDFDAPGTLPNVAPRVIRAAQPHIPIVGLVALKQAADRERCFESGCDSVVARPLARSALLEALATIHGPPRVSSDVGQNELISVIERFIHAIPKRVADLETAIEQNDLNAVSRLVHTTRDDAEATGFDVISRVATQLERSLHRGIAGSQLQTQIADLARLCLSAAHTSQERGSSFGDDVANSDG